MGCFKTRPKATASVGLELRALHQPSNAVPSHLEASSPQLPVDAWSAVEAAVLLKTVATWAVMAAFCWARGPGLRCRC